MRREKLIEIVTKICKADGTEEELGNLVTQFENAIPHPCGSDLIYWPNQWGFVDELSPEQIVDAGLSWKPKTLAMTVDSCDLHRNYKMYLVGVKVEGKMESQVVSPFKFKIGDRCIVALSGVILQNGKVVKHEFIDRAFSVGEILGLTDMPEGHEF